MPCRDGDLLQDTYWLTDPFDNKSMRGSLVAVTENEIDDLVTGRLKPRSPIVVREAMPGEPRDIIWTTNLFPIVLHKRLTRLFEEHALTGWDTYPVQVLRSSGAVINDYVGLQITGRCGPIDDTKSSQEMKAYPAGDFPILKGLFFDPATWDGSDFFMPGEEGKAGAWQFVTGNVKKVVLENGVTNVEFEPIREIEREKF